MLDVPGMILVVAPDTAFRLSLRFLLEAEGFEVVVSESFEDARLLRRKADCMIVDHDTLATQGVSLARLLEDKGPLVLLANTVEEMLQADHMRTVEKPLLGSAVVNAVQSLLQARSSAESGAT